MSKIAAEIISFMSRYHIGENQAASATDIAASLPANHTINFWSARIIDLSKSGLIQRDEFDCYFIEVA